MLVGDLIGVIENIIMSMWHHISNFLPNKCLWTEEAERKVKSNDVRVVTEINRRGI